MGCGGGKIENPDKKSSQKNGKSDENFILIDEEM